MVYNRNVYYGNNARHGGYYGSSVTAYGPNGAARVSTAYNPSTGTYARGATVATPYGARSEAQAYNPNTGTYARGASASGPKVGVETRDASTLYSMLNAIVTIPLLCMIRLDGFGFSRFGTHGLLWTDAGANLLVLGVVAVIFMAYGLKLRRVADSHAMASASTIS